MKVISTMTSGEETRNLRMLIDELGIEDRKIFVCFTLFNLALKFLIILINKNNF